MGCGSSKAVVVNVAGVSQPTGNAPTKPPEVIGSTPGNESLKDSDGDVNNASSPDDSNERGKRSGGDEQTVSDDRSFRKYAGGAKRGGSVQDCDLGEADHQSSEAQVSAQGYRQEAKRFEAFDVLLNEPTEPSSAGGGRATPVGRPPRRLQKLETTSPSLTAEELLRRQRKQEERRAAELEKKKEGGRRHSRRDRFRQEVMEARQSHGVASSELPKLRSNLPLPAINGTEKRSQGNATCTAHEGDDHLTNGLGSVSGSDLQVAELEKDDDTSYYQTHRANGNEAGDQSSSEEW